MADASIWQPGAETPLVNAESTFLVQQFIATAGQVLYPVTAFTYVLNTHSLFVWVNGVLQTVGAVGAGMDVEETSRTSFTLTWAPDAGDKVVAVGVVGSTNTAAAETFANAAAASAASAAAIYGSVTALNSAVTAAATSAAASRADSLLGAARSAASATNAAASEVAAENASLSVNQTLEEFINLQYLADFGFIYDTPGTITDYGVLV